MAASPTPAPLHRHAKVFDSGSPLCSSGQMQHHEHLTQVDASPRGTLSITAPAELHPAAPDAASDDHLASLPASEAPVLSQPLPLATATSATHAATPSEAAAKGSSKETADAVLLDLEAPPVVDDSTKLPACQLSLAAEVGAEAFKAVKALLNLYTHSREVSHAISHAIDAIRPPYLPKEPSS